MHEETANILLRKIVQLLSTIWTIFFFPVLLMTLLAVQGNLNFPVEHSLAWQILHYNILAYPFFLFIAVVLSQISMRQKKYWRAFWFSLLPLANVFIEIIAADIAFFLS